MDEGNSNSVGDDVAKIISDVLQPDVSERRWAYRKAAAVLVTLDLRTLRPVGEILDRPNEEESYENLKDDSYEAGGTVRRRFLKPEVRRDTLERMTRDEMQKALAANPPADDD